VIHLKNLYVLTANDRELVELASDGSALLLLQDAIYTLALDLELAASLENRGVETYVLEADATERGLEEAISPTTERIDYTELVQLLMSKDYKVINL
jgi:sulfur relay protein TusB/DsrH